MLERPRLQKYTVKRYGKVRTVGGGGDGGCCARDLYLRPQSSCELA